MQARIDLKARFHTIFTFSYKITLFWKWNDSSSIVTDFMKAIQHRNYLVALISSLVMLLAGCVSSAPETKPVPFSITMKSGAVFVVNEKTVDVEHLIKILRKEHVPTNEPLVINMIEDIPFEAIRRLTQQLASAGYKPFFKRPRHFKIVAEGKEKSGNYDPGQHQK